MYKQITIDRVGKKKKKKKKKKGEYFLTNQTFKNSNQRCGQKILVARYTSLLKVH